MNKSFLPHASDTGQKRDTYIQNWFQDNDKRIDGRVILDIFSTLYSYRWSILLLFLIGCVVGALKAINEDPIYQANLTMAVEPNGLKGNSQFQVFNPYAIRFYETQYEMLRSRTVAETVVDSLGLVDRDDLKSILVPPSFSNKLKATLSRLPLIDAFFSEPILTLEDIDKQVYTEAERQNKRRWLTAVIQSGVQVKGTKQSQLVGVSFNSRDPGFAAEIANALVEAYINNGIESQIKRSQKTSGWLVDRLEKVKGDLSASEKKLQNYLTKNRSVDLEQRRAISSLELSSLNQEYIQARARYDELSKRYGDKHPRIAAARAERNAAQSRYNSASRGIGGSKGNEFEQSKLEREVELNQKLYDLFLSKFRETDLKSGEQLSSARIVDAALPPTSPIHPDKQKIMFMWGLGGLFLGVILSFLREQLDTTFKGPLQLENEMGISLLGVVPSVVRKNAVVEREYLKNSTSAFSESVNHIRTGVLYSDIDNPPQVILVTSSLQSEGKTTTSSNLAISLAQMGSTLLIDADLRRPRVEKIAQTKQNNKENSGLVDFVMGNVPLRDCLLKDADSENLSLILAGDPPPNPLELLSSERMKKAIEKLRENFDYIVIDAAPILPASDAIVLGQIADAVLMVVKAESTSAHLVKDAVKRLHSAQVGITGMVLTQADIARMKSYKYGGYYGTYYRNDS